MLAHFLGAYNAKSQVFIFGVFFFFFAIERSNAKNVFESTRHIICIAFIYERTRTTCFILAQRNMHCFARLCVSSNKMKNTKKKTKENFGELWIVSVVQQPGYIGKCSIIRVETRKNGVWSISVSWTRIPYQFYRVLWWMLSYSEWTENLKYSTE